MTVCVCVLSVCVLFLYVFLACVCVGAGNGLIGHNGHRFSTYDNDKTPGQCAQKYHGAWWYHDCITSALNGIHNNNPGKSPLMGVVWSSSPGRYRRQRVSEMKIKPA